MPWSMPAGAEYRRAGGQRRAVLPQVHEYLALEHRIDLVSTLVSVRQHIPAKFGFDPVNDVQVLTPMHRGLLGAASLNAELQALLNPQGASVVHAADSWKLVILVGTRALAIAVKNDKTECASRDSQQGCGSKPCNATRRGTDVPAGLDDRHAI